MTTFTAAQGQAAAERLVEQAHAELGLDVATEAEYQDAVNLRATNEGSG